MNKAKVTGYDYIDFLIGTQKVYSCAEEERVQPDERCGSSHDAYTRQLHRLFPAVERLWSEVREHIDLGGGCLIADDSTLDKFYSRKIEPVTRHRSGKHKRVVSGINPVTLMRTDGERYLPVDYRIYNKSSDGLTKNDHFRAMSRTAAKRGFDPEFILFDNRSSSLDNLKLIRSFGWLRPTRPERSRHVDPDRTGNRPVQQADISESVDIVHLKGYGMVKVFRTVRTETGREYRFLSNAHHLKTAEIAELYKEHRQTEQFFKRIRQNLIIKIFLGTSKNAVLTQVWMALCVYLMIIFLNFKVKSGVSIQRILRVL